MNSDIKSSWEDVDSSGQSEHFIHMMDVRNGLDAVQRYTRLTYDLLELRPGDSVLDVGCGPGVDALKMASLVGENGRVVGMDYSRSMVEEATIRAEEAGSNNLEFVTGDAHDLDFDDNTFDSARAVAVFHHLKNPLQAIREMKRVVKPGGKVVIAEADWGMLAIDHPDIPTTQKIIQCQLLKQRNGWIGRQLPRFLRMCGLRNVQTIPAIIIYDQYQIVDLILGLEGLLASMIEAEQLSAEDGEQWLAHLHELDAKGELFIPSVGFIVAGS